MFENNAEQQPVNQELEQTSGEVRHIKEIEAGRCPSCGGNVGDEASRNEGFCSVICLSNHVNYCGAPLRTYAEYLDIIAKTNEVDVLGQDTSQEMHHQEVAGGSVFSWEMDFIIKLKEGLCPNKQEHGEDNVEVPELEATEHNGFCCEDCYQDFISKSGFYPKPYTVYKPIINYANMHDLTLEEVFLIDRNDERGIGATF